MLVGGVVHHHFGDDSQVALMSLAQKRFEVPQAAVDRIDPGVVGDVVAVVP